MNINFKILKFLIEEPLCGIVQCFEFSFFYVAEMTHSITENKITDNLFFKQKHIKSGKQLRSNKLIKSVGFLQYIIIETLET